MTTVVTGLSMFLTLAVAAAPASADDTSAEDPTAHCEAVFGDESDHEENQRMREQRIESVMQVGDHADILYFEDVEEPSLMSIKGMTLVSSSIDDGVAEVRIESESGLPCEAGAYTLTTDQSIGRDAHVVAVLDDAVLLEFDGELRYLLVDGARVDWNLIWRSRFSIATPKTGKGRAARHNPKVRNRRGKRR
ncbi:MAG: hypothetical protein RMA76_38615 [Deltaproteobacteria bacterium]|jgi:hypothetical protein